MPVDSTEKEEQSLCKDQSSSESCFASADRFNAQLGHGFLRDCKIATKPNPLDFPNLLAMVSML